eukprot:877202-Amphidinium_carterae.2
MLAYLVRIVPDTGILQQQGAVLANALLLPSKQGRCKRDRGDGPFCCMSHHALLTEELLGRTRRQTLRRLRCGL